MAPECLYVIPHHENHRGYDGGRVDPTRAAVGMINPDPRLKGLGEIKTPVCQLQRCNDGQQLPIKRIGNERDVTCVGPDNPACPAQQGYSIAPVEHISTTIYGPRTVYTTRRQS